ncbi:penicillin-binding protein, beta-lactamase class C [Sphaerochaeta pleomorpha str. Grapes]|uniref:Penicillin-binding protein, beta-lactamase class C n=1 Tax=Sphaerochaeta pleomorpha (strain ATCC BAA-1885 / DSM 22778 / Grapes) TaxID=158190 RepID=G8QRB8_SPHPG|nr:serine hydrolase [Sphaerochaeta pleomorpha]AEV28771.1 penicillin-binding protein, beta-lactamase class C [Sphaerochaeta pleomorpha str. Grapes]
MDSNALNLYLQEIQDQASPCVSAVVLSDSSVLYRKDLGYRQLVPQALPLTKHTLFDLASLTKVVGTLMATLRLMEKKELSLAMNLGFLLSDAGNYKETTLGQLLTHTGGFIPEMRLELYLQDCEDALTFMLSQPVRYKPGTKVEYSCFGYIILAKILEKITGIPFEKLVKQEVSDPLGMHKTVFNPLLKFPEAQYAATERLENTNEILCGIVHDENSRFLGGIAGNAGLFSTAEDLTRFCRMFLCKGQSEQGTYLSTETMNLLFNLQTGNCEGEKRTLGFKIADARLLGTNASAQAIGHTGFTGTSIAIDPLLNRAAILLCNRVHPSRKNNVLLGMRQGFHTLAFQ